MCFVCLFIFPQLCPDFLYQCGNGIDIIERFECHIQDGSLKLFLRAVCFPFPKAMSVNIIY